MRAKEWAINCATRRWGGPHGAGNRFEGEQSMTDRWSRRHEAQLFVRMVQAGQMTLEEAEAGIRMNDSQRKQCRRFLPHEVAIIERIWKAREETWQAFLFLCSGGRDGQITESRAEDPNG
jgi:hypothetical protein